MRIYNGTKKTLTLPYAGGENLTIAPKTPSGNVLCTNDFISMLITSYTTDEIAIIASGPFEITACANVPAAVNYVVQSLEEAIKRFHPEANEEKIDRPEPKKEEPKPEVKPEEPKVEEKKEEPKPEEQKNPGEPKKLEPVEPKKKKAEKKPEAAGPIVDGKTEV